jgi:hypothetical protein
MKSNSHAAIVNAGLAVAKADRDLVASYVELGRAILTTAEELGMSEADTIKASLPSLFTAGCKLKRASLQSAALLAKHWGVVRDAPSLRQAIKAASTAHKEAEAAKAKAEGRTLPEKPKPKPRPVSEKQALEAFKGLAAGWQPGEVVKEASTTLSLVLGDLLSDLPREDSIELVDGLIDRLKQQAAALRQVKAADEGWSEDPPSEVAPKAKRPRKPKVEANAA